MRRGRRLQFGALPLVAVTAILALSANAFAQQPPSLDRIAAAIRGGQPAEAVRLAELLSQASPGDPRPLTLKGLALAAQGLHEEAVKAYESALAATPDYLPALQGAAELQLRLGRPEAGARLARIVQLQPGNATAHAMLGVLAYRKRDCESALRHFAEGRSAAEADPEVLSQRAECRFLAGSYGESAADFRRLVALDASRHDLRHNLALALHEAERHEEAVEALRPAIDSSGTADLDTLSLMADAQYAALDSPGALATLQQAIRSYPRVERLYLQLAELCLEHGSYDLGIEVADTGTKNIPGSHRILTMRGILLAELGRYEDAEESFLAAARADDDAQSAAVGLSLTLQKTGRIDESVEVLRERVARNPEDGVARFFYSQALVKRGVNAGSAEFEEALEGLLVAVERLPGEAQPRVELGKLYLRAGQLDDAIGTLREASRLAPGDRQATYNLMIALRRAGRAEEAAVLALRIRKQLDQSKDDEIRRNRFRLFRTDGEP